MAEADAVASSVSELRTFDGEFDVDILSQEINRYYQQIWKSRRWSWPDYKYEKSLVEAIKSMCKGRILFEKKNYHESLIFFSRSAAFAPTDSIELFFAYAERSAVLFHLEEYEVCLMDVNRALLKNCSERQRKILEDRKTICLTHLKKKHPFAKINPEIIDKSDTSIEYYTVKEVENITAFRKFETRKTYPLNVSHKVKLEYDAEKGNYMVATADINKSEILSIEGLFVVALDDGKRYTNCSYCLEKFPALIPCETCTREMYCSIKCSNRAYNTYHRTECKIIKFYQRTGEVNLKETLAVRAFLMSTRQGGWITVFMEKLKPRDIFKGNLGREPLHWYFSALELCDLKLQPFDRISLLEETIKVVPLAVEIEILFRRLMIFGQSDVLPESLNKVDMYAVLLLINYLVSMGRSKFQVMECTRMKNDVSKVPQFDDDTILGYGIYLIQNLIQHSCSPNTFAFIESRARFLVASENIKAGEKLYFTHSHHCMDVPLDKRAERFAACKFTCDCVACSTKEVSNEDDRNGDIIQPSVSGTNRKQDSTLAKLEPERSVQRRKPIYRSFIINNFYKFIPRHEKKLKVMHHYYVTGDTEKYD